jgi:hypothetical protein
MAITTIRSFDDSQINNHKRLATQTHQELERDFWGVLFWLHKNLLLYSLEAIITSQKNNSEVYYTCVHTHPTYIYIFSSRSNLKFAMI